MEGSADGLTDGLSWNGGWETCILTRDRGEVSADFADPFVYIDLEAVYEVGKVSLAPPGKVNALALSGGMKIVVSESPLDSVSSFNEASPCTTVPDDGFDAASPQDSSEDFVVVDFECAKPVQGRYVGFINEGTNKMIAFCEAEVYCHNGPNPSPSPTFSPSAAPTTPPTAAPSDAPSHTLEFEACPGDGNLALDKPVGYNEDVGLDEIMNDDDGIPITSGATDGETWNDDYTKCIFTNKGDSPFVYIDLEAVHEITKVALATPGNANQAAAAGGTEIVVSMNPLDSVDRFREAAPCATVPADGFSAPSLSGETNPPVIDVFGCEAPVQGRYVGFINKGSAKAVLFCEAEVYCSDEAIPSPPPTFSPSAAPTTPPTAAPTHAPSQTLALQHCPDDGINLALGKPVGYNHAVGLHEIMEGSADGLTDGLSWNGGWETCILTRDRGEVSADFADPFVYIDLEAVYEVGKVSLAPPGKVNALALSGGMKIVVSESPLDSVSSFNEASPCTTVPDDGFDAASPQDSSEDFVVVDFECAKPVQGRYVGFINEGTNKMIAFCEAEVYCSPFSHWIAAGNVKDDIWDSLPNVECAEDPSVEAINSNPDGDDDGDDIGVSCCSDDESGGVTGVRKFDGQCYQARTYLEAKAICKDNGLRLCSLSEMLGKVTKGEDCGHDARYNWVADRCASTDSGHYVHQGSTKWNNWADGAKDFYCQSDSSNQAAYYSTKFKVDIGVSCCYKNAATDEVEGTRKCKSHPSTFAEAEQLCADDGQRLCTLDELKTAITRRTGCNYDCIYEWSSTSCDPSVNAAASYSIRAQDAIESSDDFAAITLGAAVGVAMVAVVVAVILVMRRRKGMDNGKEQEVAMREVVTATNVQSMDSMDGVVAMSEEVTAPRVQPVESIDGVETV